MFQIDQRPYRASLDNAQAQLTRARATEQLETIRNQRAQFLIHDEAISQGKSSICAVPRMRRAPPMFTPPKLQWPPPN